MGKTICHFSLNFNPLRKTWLRTCLFPFEILSNENFFKLFVGNSLLPNCKEGYKREGFTVNIYNEAVLINEAKKI